MKFIYVFIYVMLAIPAMSQIYLPTGDVFGKIQGKSSSREPFEVVDTLKLVDGYGAIKFNDRFTTELHNVKATGIGNVYPFVTQVLTDTSQTVNYYSVYVSSGLDSVIVKSNSATDTSSVRVRILMR